MNLALLDQQGILVVFSGSQQLIEPKDQCLVQNVLLMCSLILCGEGRKIRIYY